MNKLKAMYVTGFLQRIACLPHSVPLDQERSRSIIQLEIKCASMREGVVYAHVAPRRAACGRIHAGCFTTRCTEAATRDSRLLHLLFILLCGRADSID